MILTRLDLKRFILEERKYYRSQYFNKINWLLSSFLQDNLRKIMKYLVVLRKSEYYYNNSFYRTKKLTNCFNDLISLYYIQKRNRLGRELGIEISDNIFDIGLVICHSGSIIVNSNCKVGKNCVIHGDCCIGNDGIELDGVPKIGDNVDIGIGAKILGDITIANNITIGANSVVTKSFEEEGIVIAGLPARCIGRNKKRGTR